MSDDERQQRIRDYEDMARAVAYAPDKALFQRQADELRQRTSSPVYVDDVPPRRRRWF